MEDRGRARGMAKRRGQRGGDEREVGKWVAPRGKGKGNVWRRSEMGLEDAGADGVCRGEARGRGEERRGEERRGEERRGEERRGEERRGEERMILICLRPPKSILVGRGDSSRRS
ncbi:hypothetical protein V5P93_005856 [Actinokineospora auranticolor]|uniref:hypothetical protein n=1 Tax=Actinokineospora auranticolor TaxID=155976 RepID=UPI0035A86BF8